MFIELTQVVSAANPKDLFDFNPVLVNIDSIKTVSKHTSDSSIVYFKDELQYPVYIKMDEDKFPAVGNFIIVIEDVQKIKEELIIAGCMIR